jgi:hypothetical protein
MYVSARHLARAMDLVPSMLQLNDPKCADNRIKGKKGHKRPRPRYGPDEIAVFKAIAAMMADKDDPKKLMKLHSAFPSLIRLTSVTQLSVSAVWRAVTTLVEDKYLRTTRIPGRLLRGSKSKNKWEAHRYWPGEAWGNPSTWSTHGDEVPTETEPTMKPNPEDDAIAEELAAGTGPAAPEKNEESEKPPANEEEFGKVFDYLTSKFTDHPTIEHSNARSMLGPAIKSMLALSTDAVGVMSVLEQQADEMIAAVAKSRHLGGYLAQAYPGWLQRAREQQEELELSNQDWLDEAFEVPDFCRIKYSETFDMAMIDDFDKWFKKSVGTHLLQFDPFEEDGHKYADVKFSPQYIVSRLLTRCCGKTIDPDDLRTNMAEDTPAVCRWAIHHPRWSKRLNGVGGEAGTYFTQHYGEIGADRDEAETDGDSVEIEPDYDYPDPPDRED